MKIMIYSFLLVLLTSCLGGGGGSESKFLEDGGDIPGLPKAPNNQNPGSSEPGKVYAEIIFGYGPKMYIGGGMNLRRGGPDGERISIGMLHWDNILYCNGQQAALPGGSVNHSHTTIFGRFDYRVACNTDKGQKTFDLQLVLRDEDIAGVYNMQITLPEPIKIDPIEFDNGEHMMISDTMDLSWEPADDPVQFVFEIIYGYQHFFPKYSRLVEEQWADDPGQYVVESFHTENIAQYPLQGRFNLYRTRPGIHDPKLIGRSYGYSWSRTESCNIVRQNH
ncbi:MAG: hypothetical protein AAF203_02380 [Pseudomonadota bacterium]